MTMKEQMSQSAATVDHLIESILKKLQANRSVLVRSVQHGRLSWRLNKKNGEIEVDLELKL
jgi:hypothetical protein